MWNDGERDQNHVFLVELSNNSISMNKWGCVARLFVHASNFSSFVSLKVVVCIGSDDI